MHGDNDNHDTATLAASRRFARVRRIWWREALTGIVGAPGRLRRYRHLHARLLDEALCGRRDSARGDRCE